MNMPLVSMNRRRRIGGAATPVFSPSALFALAEPGVWYDPSDLTTLFQDTAGTTPVTTPGQTVALALDKSKGLVLGPELVTNGTFDGGSTGWTVGSSWSVSGGKATINTVGAYSFLDQARAFVAGRTYQISLVISDFGAGSAPAGLILKTTNATVRSFTANGTYTFLYVADGTETLVRFGAGSPNASYSVDNISVKELPGFHATQATLASRPTYGIVPLGGRRNLLTRTEEFDNAVWIAAATNATATKGTISTGRPDGSSGSVNTLTFSSVPSTAGSYAWSYQVLGATYLNTAVSYSVWLRVASGTGTVYLNVEDSAAGPTGSNFFSSPALTLTTSWQRFTVTGTRASGTGNAVVSVGFDTRAAAGQTNASSLTVQVWGAQLETGSSATAYQRVGSAFDVTEAGVASLSYLNFNGINNFMVTPTITPGIDRAQVFAGVRKLSDAATGVIAEYSATIASNNGSFYLLGPRQNNTSTYDFTSRGTTLSGAAFISGYVAPISNILTGLGDISGDRQTLRVNGTQVAQDMTDQGSGNFLAYPLYIGMRAGSSLPFNGNLFSLIVRFGTNLDAGTITSTETWVNGKTGAYA